jgi:hypothetical protein
VGTTLGVAGAGDVGVGGAADGEGGWVATAAGSAKSRGVFWNLDNIDFSISVHVDADGNVSIAGGSHDAFPSFEVWAYDAEGNATRVYHHADTGKLSDLKGEGAVKVPNKRPR